MTTQHRGLDEAYPLKAAEVPPSWAIVALADIVTEVESGFSSATHNRTGDGVRHLRPMNIDTTGSIILEQLLYVPATVDARRTHHGDVLFNNTNSRALVGKTAPVELGDASAYSNHLTRLRPAPGVDFRFLAYQLHFLWRSGYFRVHAKQHVNQASVSRAMLAESVPILLPPSHEQLAISAELRSTLHRLQAATIALDRATRRVRELEKAILAGVVDGTLMATVEPAVRGHGVAAGPAPDAERPPSPGVGLSPQLARASQNGPGALPKGWEWSTIGDVGELTLGISLSSKRRAGTRLRPYLRVANVLDDRIDATDVRKAHISEHEEARLRLRAGDILLNEGQSPDLVGRAAMFRDEVPGACFQNSLIRFRSNPGISPGYCLLVFRHYLRSGRFRRAARWTTNIAHLSLDRLARIEFPVPPLTTQEAILEEARVELARAQAVLEASDRSRRRIGTLRDDAYRSAFTGALAAQETSGGTGHALADQVRELGARRTNYLVRRPRVPRRRRAPIDTSGRRDIIGILKEVAGLSPEELLRQSGVPEDDIETFYAELARAMRAGLVEERRSEGRVYLTYREGVHAAEAAID